MKAHRVMAVVAALALLPALAPAATARPPRQDPSVARGYYVITDPTSALFLSVKSEQVRDRVTVLLANTVPLDYRLWHVDCPPQLGCAVRNAHTGTYLAVTGLPRDGLPVVTRVSPYRWDITQAWSAEQGAYHISRFTSQVEYRVARSAAEVLPPLVEVWRADGSAAAQQWKLTLVRDRAGRTAAGG
ncbi:MAG: hypothetical protein HOV94_38500 [Saccharothrix sp.]|nr:hypothetical protein [Saccharothrix sp.]